MIRNPAITNRRPNHGTVGKSHRTFTVTRHPKDNKSKATSSLFIIKMIEELERTTNTVACVIIVYEQSVSVRVSKNW